MAALTQETRPTSFSSLEAFLRAKHGTRPIHKVLIANNGIAAVKVMRSLRQWAFETLGDAGQLTFVAMATPEDMAANALYIGMADQVARVPGGANHFNYANVRTIVQVALAHKVDAVWAGWGHASENPKLPAALEAAGVLWIGPTASSMHDLGDKIASTILAQSAEVSCIPWSGSGVTVQYQRCSGVPDTAFKKACVATVDEALASAEGIGYPLMIKASEGGGGKGVRRVDAPEDMVAGLRQVQAEVPGSPVFLMKMAQECRHLEVQLLGDVYGNAVALAGRDCSIQRRYQKIIEEGPVVSTPPEVWRAMEDAAVRLAKTVGYIGAGTVEYLYHPGTQQYYFLELNPRLQVEHPVTELITGVNLPAAQLLVTMGVPLHCIPEIRVYFGYDATGTDPVELSTPVPLTKHVIACRITAEDPGTFQPTSGRVEDVTFRSTPETWGYFSVGSNGRIHEFSDSQFGHVFAVGVDREAARQNMLFALTQLSVRGEIRTTVQYLRVILDSADYRRNALTTSWLEAELLQKQKQEEEPVPPTLAVVLAALFRGFHRLRAAHASLCAAIAAGRVVPESYAEGLVAVDVDLIHRNVRYGCGVSRTGPDTYAVDLNGGVRSIQAHSMPDGGLHVCLGRTSYTLYGSSDTHLGFRLTVNGFTVEFTKEYDPSEVRAAMAGRLLGFLVPDGARVARDAVIAEVEVMKMVVQVSCQEPGVLRHAKPEGAVLCTGDLLATLELDEPDAAPKAVHFTGALDPEPEDPDTRNAYTRLLEHEARLTRMLQGYKFNSTAVDTCLSSWLALLRDPLLILHEVTGLLSSLTGRIPQALHDTLTALGQSFTALNTGHRFRWEEPYPFPVLETENAILGAQETDPALEPVLAPVLAAVLAYRGSDTYAVRGLARVLDQFYTDHTELSNASDDFLFNSLRVQHSPDRVLELAMTLGRVTQVVDLVHRVLGVLDTALAPLVPEFTDVLTRLSAMQGVAYAKVACKARQMVLSTRSTDTGAHRRVQVAAILSTVEPGDDGPARLARVKSVIDIPERLGAVLKPLMLDPDLTGHARAVATEVYIRRVYRAFALTEIDLVAECAAAASAHWVFHAPDVSDAGGRMHRADSLLDVRAEAEGWLFGYDSWEHMKESLPEDLGRLPRDSAAHRHVLHVVINWIHGKTPPDALLAQSLTHNVRGLELDGRGVRRLSFSVLLADGRCAQFTFRHRLGYAEDPLIRHLEPTQAVRLELHRLALHSGVQQLAPDTPHHAAVSTFTGCGASGPRIFARLAVPTSDADALETALLEALDAIEVLLAAQSYSYNHVFLNCVAAAYTDVQPGFAGLCEQYSETLQRLAVAEVELRCGPDDRLVYTNPTGYVGQVVREPAGDTPYPVAAPHQAVRECAARNNTLWVHDFPAVLEAALSAQWGAGRRPEPLVTATPLHLDGEGVLRPGVSACGMVAWDLVLHTPEHPGGRAAVLVANDITHRAGSFGPSEDDLYSAASDRARARGLPLLYFAANSGARIGLAAEVRDCFRVAWRGDRVDYLYLSEADYERVGASVCAERVEADGETRYRLTDIIGQEPGLGVENLAGSGRIAGQTSAAYDEVFTLSYVTGRSVGIGAYLVRLGQRVVQKQGQAILLTGFRALNQLLGRPVYSSNAELGGTGIMHPNGIAHVVVPDDLAGMHAVLTWLRYVPPTRTAGVSVPRLGSLADPVARSVPHVPCGHPEDARRFLASLFDAESFTETLGGWARTLVTGRARLGGIPVGVVAVETQSKDRTVLADYAVPESREQVVTQAGQVWYPDSAYKTATAIRDLDREGLPLFILANFRGFSGGMSDMAQEVLKFGAYIVDALRVYSQPVFVYIVPRGELRGGAWVVLDPSINPRRIELYADPSARGGILEPSGVVSVKYRPAEVLRTARRCEPEGEQDPEELLARYTGVATKFADLHDTPGRMLAVDAIRAVVPGHQAREFFYWRLRLRVEQLQLERRYPDLDVEAVLQGLDMPADDQAACEWLETSAEAVTAHMQALARASKMTKLSHALAGLSPDERQALLATLD